MPEHLAPPVLLELENVQKQYESPGETIHAVRGACLTVREGERLALLGPSGCGKSTLLLLAGGLLRADGGSVRYSGRDLAEFSKPRRSPTGASNSASSSRASILRPE